MRANKSGSTGDQVFQDTTSRTSPSYTTQMKGIIMAGGLGTRLQPLTTSVSKQLLPVYNKPMIWYPLSTLMLAGIREVAIICKPDQLQLFERLLGNGGKFGISINYFAQEEANGIPTGILLASSFLGKSKFALILGDNLFWGNGLGRALSSSWPFTGAKIFGSKVLDPKNYGVAVIDSSGKLESIVEKPQSSISRIAIPGLYFYDHQAISFSSELAPSARGELEISDLNLRYLSEGILSFDMLPRGTAWMDTGSFEALNEASNFIRILENRTGIRIGDPMEVANEQGWLM